MSQRTSTSNANLRMFYEQCRRLGNDPSSEFYDNSVPRRGDENMVAYWNGRSGMKAHYPRDTFAFAAYSAGRDERADDRAAGNLMPPFEIRHNGMIYAPGGWSPNITAATQMLIASDDGERIVAADETEQCQATIPAELFRRAGVALFGDQYVAPMAVALGVDKNTVGKWAAGKTRIPPGAWLEVRAMIHDRYSQIFPRLLAEIDTSAVCEKPSPNVRDGGQVSTGDLRRK